ncbi:MAG TPA: hypothetical protein VFN30_14110 [Chitinophagaceae bacterium]|nr:hypothetical protein [Chitinophagaceae bacterium]
MESKIALANIKALSMYSLMPRLLSPKNKIRHIFNLPFYSIALSDEHKNRRVLLQYFPVSNSIKTANSLDARLHSISLIYSVKQNE